MLSKIFNGALRQIHPFKNGRLGSNMWQQFAVVAGVTLAVAGIPGITELFTGMANAAAPGLKALIGASPAPV